MSDIESNNCTWRGVPLTDIYGSDSPWDVPEFPIINPAYNHTVLFHMPYNYQEKPPKPQTGQHMWDHDFVRLPFSKQSLYPVIGVSLLTYFPYDRFFSTSQDLLNHLFF